MPTEDPRIYFAAERTHLAWTRTAIALMGLGFVVARFGLFLHMIARDDTPHDYRGSLWIGTALVSLGVLTAASSTVQHARYRKALPVDQTPSRYWMGQSVSFGALLAAVGITLAVYLMAG